MTDDLPVVSPPFDVDSRDDPPRVAAVLLAAGTSDRFGTRNKLLATHERDPVVDAMTAHNDETVIHPDVGTNVPDGERLEFGDIEGAFEAADHVVEGSYDWGHISGVPLETAGVVADYDPDGDAFEIDCNIQLHTFVDDTVFEKLGYSPEKVELDVLRVGANETDLKIALWYKLCHYMKEYSKNTTFVMKSSCSQKERKP